MSDRSSVVPNLWKPRTAMPTAKTGSSWPEKTNPIRTTKTVKLVSTRATAPRRHIQDTSPATNENIVATYVISSFGFFGFFKHITI